MATTDSYLSATIASLVLYGIFIIPLLVLWIISLCTGRRKGDPARVGFAWMKAIFPFYLLRLILIAVGYGVRLSMYYSLYLSRYEELYIRAFAVAGFLGVISSVLVLICFVELGVGFLYCLSGARTAAQKAMRYAAWGAGAVLFVLGLARFGVQMAAWTAYFNWDNSSSAYDYDNYETARDALNRQLQTVRNLVAAYDILYWIINIGLVVMGSFILHKVRNNPMLRHSATLLLVATILSFIRWLWAVVYDGVWLLNIYAVEPIYVDTVDAVLDSVVTFVFLVLLLVMSTRKKDGLWSTQQPWTGNGVHTAYAPAGYTAPIPQQQQWQAPPQQQYQQYPQYPQYQQYPPQNAYTAKQTAPGELEHP